MRSTLLLPLLAASALGLAACGDKDTSTTGEDSAGGDANTKPIAEAGNPATQSADNAVSLSGAASSDPDGDALTWHWSFDHTPEGSALGTSETAFASNASAQAVSTSFMPDAVGTYVIQLKVQDVHGAWSDPDYVIITVEEPENLPVANAGSDVATAVGDNVSLDGSRSYDPLGRALTYSWSLVDKPTGSSLTSLSSNDTATASFAPDAKGVYVANLVVNNGLASSISDAVTITAVGDDSAPVANAGEDSSVEDCTYVQLDCSQSRDPDSDALTYQWEVQSKPTGSLAGTSSFSDRTSERPTFWPDVAGEYVLSCAVSDGSTWSSPDMVALTADERASNSRPSVDAGTDATSDGGSATCEESGYSYDCDECAAVTMTVGDTAVVTDADSDPMTYLWSTENENITISDPTSLVTTVVLSEAAPTEPGECEETEYELTLTVTDCTGSSQSDDITMTVSCCGVADTSSSR